MQRVLLVVFALSGCFIDTVSPEGKACDSSHPCGEGFSCVSVTCPAEPTGANLVGNGDFADVSGWSARSAATGLEAQTRVVISGRTARIFGKANTTSQRLEVNASLADAGVGALVCAQARLLSAGFDRNIHLVLAGVLRDGGVESPTPTELLADTSAYIGPGDQRNVPHLVATSLQPNANFVGAMVTVLGAPPVSLSDEFFVDDVRVWAMPAKTCQPQ